jgi:K+-transporting ATPase KdpF subunit
MLANQGEAFHAGCGFRRRNADFFRGGDLVRARMRAAEAGRRPVSADNAILICVSVFLLGYLLYALLKAEDF